MADQAATSGKLPAQVVKETLNRINPGWLEHQDRVRRFNRAYEVYRGQVRESRTLKAWQTRLYVKYGMQVIDQAIANMIQGQPKAECTPRRQQDEVASKAMEILLGYYADQDHLAEKEEVVIKQALIYGVSPAKNSWYYKEADKTVGYQSQIDPETGQTLWRKTRDRIIECDRPCFTPWDAYDVWWDPHARNVEFADYVVLRDYLTKDELQQRQYNETDGTGTYKNLQLLFSKGPGEQPDTSSQNQIMNVQHKYKDRFEILEIWRDSHLTVLGNRQVMLYDGEKPFWMAGKPVVIGSSRPDMFRIEGISETELVDHLQQALHMVTNLRMDNLKFTVNRGVTYRDGLNDPTRLVMRPAFQWPVTDHDDIHFHDQPALPPEAYQEEETLLGRLQYVTGITPYITGASGTGMDQKTATGVSLLQESASRLLTFKPNVDSVMNVWQRTFEQWADLTRQFLTDEQDIRIMGPGNTYTWVKLGPEMVYGDFDVRIQAGDESLSRQQERAEAIALLNALAPYAQAGLVDLHPLLEKVAQSYDMKDVSALLPPPRPQAAPQQNGNQAPTGPTPFTVNGGGIAPQPAQAYLRGNAR